MNSFCVRSRMSCGMTSGSFSSSLTVTLGPSLYPRAATGIGQLLSENPGPAQEEAGCADAADLLRELTGGHAARVGAAADHLVEGARADGDGGAVSSRDDQRAWRRRDGVPDPDVHRAVVDAGEVGEHADVELGLAVGVG